ncbi:MAG: TspO/MBR family protein [Candidatus Aminicenantia bacterium]
MKFNLLKFFSSLVITLGVGFIGSLATTPFVKTWYATIKKPPINPPNWIFAPVWTLLFILMGISLYLVWGWGFCNRTVRIAMLIFFVQLLFNILWSILFFTFHSPTAGFVDIVFLWFSILLTIIYFFKISPASGYLLIPYILWVSFAAVLNFWIMLLNR